MDADNAKKWGRVFMGRRESSLGKIDAMQSVALQEQHQHKVEEDYFERVKLKAAERAKEILGAAYAERQQVLAAADAEGRERAAALTAAAQEQLAAAAQEQADAAQVRQEAECLKQEAQAVRDKAHSEGYEAGLAQAKVELVEFRAQMGDALGAVMAAVQYECRTIFDLWREDLVALCRAAVEKSVNLVLRDEHRTALENTLIQAVRQLEDQSVIRLRVHPDDEAVVGDMLLAAREQLPELRQWTVHGDPTLEPGSIVADNEHGSVDHRRTYCRELVESVLDHLHLPPLHDDADAHDRIAAIVHHEAERIAGLTSVPQDQAAAPVAEDVAVPASHGTAETVAMPSADTVAAEAVWQASSAAPDVVDNFAMPEVNQDTGTRPVGTPAPHAQVEQQEIQSPTYTDTDAADSLEDLEATYTPHAQATPETTAGTAAVPHVQIEGQKPTAMHPTSTPTAPDEAARQIPSATSDTNNVMSQTTLAKDTARSSADIAPTASPTASVDRVPTLEELENELFADNLSDMNEQDAVLATGGFLSPEHNKI